MSRGQTHFSRERDYIGLLVIALITLNLQIANAYHAEYTVSNVVDEGYEVFEMTAYTADCRGCLGITKSGYDVRSTIYSPNGHRVIATDPSVIPLHTLVEIRLGDGTAFTARSLDIGGAIKGNRIDLLKRDYESAVEFGRQDVELRILEEAVVDE